MLNVLEDTHVEFKNYNFPFSSDEINSIKKTICSFLNSFGGRIYLGIQDKNLKVQGIKLFGH